MGRLGVNAAALLGLCLGFAAAIGPAKADKVGVAAAVNPDAFSSLAGSPLSQLSIGKSIFFNERINTTTNGLVQVLLVDGSTFTVGPGSDLVIDKFVYDPKKQTGQVVASFSKGVMRFVGGKISKNENGVTVNTPAGALAIRGGMFQAKLNGSSGIFSFLFGKQMTLGSKYTVFEPGYTIDTTAGSPSIRPTTSADINSIMAGLTNGSTGGLGTTNDQNSGDPSADLQKAASADQAASQLISDANTTQIQGEIQNQSNQPSGTPPETVTLPTELALRVLASPEFYVANKRSFWSPGVFIVDPGAHGIVGGNDHKIPCFIAAVCDPDQRFFQVQSEDFDVASDSIANGRVTGTIQPLIEFQGFDPETHRPIYGYTPTGTFDFPIFNVVGVHAVTDAVAIDENGTTTLVGSAFTGRGGGFFAYQLFEASEIAGVMVADLNKPVLAFGGTTFTPPPDQPDQLRLFNLFSDPRQGISIPFAAAETSPTNLTGATVQPLYLLEDTSVGGRSVWLQTSFLISGQGTDQQSILVLALGEQNADGQLTGLRRGMSRAEIFVPNSDPLGAPVSRGIQTINLTGSIATLAGPKDGDVTPYLFGDTIPHFVIGADSTGNGHKIFEDQPLHPEAFLPDGSIQPLVSVDGPSNFTQGPLVPPSEFTGATYHIGEQAAQANASTVVPVTSDEDVDLYGYAGGIYQQTTDNLNQDQGEVPVGILANTAASDVHLKFKDDHRLSALFDLHIVDAEGGATLAFGDWGTAHGRSAVISDKIYAAVESATVPTTVTVENNNEHITRGADASLYIVSSGLLGNTGSVQLCTNCDFIKWGTWGGQLQFKDGGSYPQTDVTADVNLGWYVVGDITTDDDFNDAAFLALGPTATYNGTAIGNVANNIDGSGWKTYVATGDLTMNWNFANRLGDLTISKFDAAGSGVVGGLTFAGAMCAPGVGCNTPTGNHFGGPLSVTTANLPNSLNDLNGNAVGSFVNNGSTVAAGVIGNWNVHNELYGAAGIFGGKR